MIRGVLSKVVMDAKVTVGVQHIWASRVNPKDRRSSMADTWGFLLGVLLLTAIGLAIGVPFGMLVGWLM